ncbi:MAG: VWA domain-containing protein [Labilithrix sp.]|nr:VWA domain-containing protein [Labilithrix sp.]
MPARLSSLRARFGQRLFHARRRLVPAALAAAFTAAMLSCGSRTGLFGPDSDFFTGDATIPDAGVADAPDDGPVQCIPGRFGFELALTQLMFVLDRSGSMRFSLSGVPDVSRSRWRWTVLQNALRRTITTFDDEIAMGAKFFPEALPFGSSVGAERACRTDTGVGIAPARGNAQAIISAFDLTEPLGGTPTSEAIRLATQFLTERRSVARTMVLATDGAPNCNGDLDRRSCICTATSPQSCREASEGDYSCLDDTRTLASIRDTAENRKIPVYVIGIGSTERPEFLDVLDQMAIAGGRPRATAPRHYNVQSENDLTEALTTIRDAVAKCTYLTPSAPNDPDNITVEIDGVLIPRDQTKTNGWDWVDRSYGELAFFGEACARAQGSGGLPAAVSGVVTCDE